MISNRNTSSDADLYIMIESWYDEDVSYFETKFDLKNKSHDTIVKRMDAYVNTYYLQRRLISYGR